MEFGIASTSMLAKVPRAPALSVALSEKVSGCVLQHPVSFVRTVNLPCGCVTVAAGAGVVSAGVVKSLLRPLSVADGEVVDDSGVSVPSGEMETIVVTSGLVTCMTVSLLPGGGAALGVVGTSQGSLCLFVVESGSGGRPPALFKICEISLLEYSNGLISAEDAVTDVCIGFDPAGRPEFIAAAAVMCVVVVDTQHFDESFKAKATEGVVQALTKRHLSHVGLSTSETFCVSFSTADVIRILVPERYHAAFAVDVALVIVLDNGDVRYVERSVVGGSVQLLLEHHKQRQARQSEVGLSMLLDDSLTHGGPRALPHVLYAYHLSTLVHNVCALAVGSHAAANIVLNDAALCYDSTAHQMRLIVAGAEAHSDERSEQLCGWTGWWALAHGVVCPFDTLSQAQPPTVVGFNAPKSGSLPRNRCGLSAVVAISDSQLLFSCGNGLHLCAFVEPLGADYGALRHVYTAGSAVSSVARVESWAGGRSAVVAACGSSLALLQI